MKFIVKIIRNSITRALYRQRVQAANAMRHELENQHTEQLVSLHNLRTAAFKSTHQNLNYLQQTISAQVQTRGLLELIQKPENSFLHGRGDFSSMNSDHFVHTLGFSNSEIENPTFYLSEVQTTVSQTIEDLSILRKPSAQGDAVSRGEQLSPFGEELRVVQEDMHHKLMGNQISRILRMELAIN